MKSKYIQIIVSCIILAVFTVMGVHRLEIYYDEILSATGLDGDDFEKELKLENEKAAESEENYQKIINSLEIDDDQEEGSGNQKNEIKQPSLRAMSALLLDATNNRVLYEKDGYKKRAMASTTKIMTCIVVLENADLNDVVTVSSYAAGMPDVQLNIRKDEKYYLKDFLYSLMLESHNDVAVAIAEHVGGSVEGFATMMNDKAKELGCFDTNFITPNGLDAENHYTTARDLAVIGSYAIKNKQFIDITNTSSHSFSEINHKRSFRVTNKNKFLYMMEGAIGIKTGFTGDAGYCFVGAIKRQDRSLISVVLGCGWPPSRSLKWSDTKELMAYGVNHYEEKQIFKAIEFEPVFVKKGQQKYVTLEIEGDLSLLIRKDEKVKVVYSVPRFLNAPVKEGEEVGNARYYIDETLYAVIPVYTQRTVSKIDFNFCIKEIMKMWSIQY